MVRSLIVTLLKIVGVATAILLALASSAAAQDSTPDHMTLSDRNVVRGKTVIATGTGCTANTDLSFNFDGRLLTTTRTDASGSFRAPLTAPRDTSSGPHTLLATAQGCAFTAQVTIAAADNGTNGFLDFSVPHTTVLWITLALIAAGTAVTFGLRRRANVRARLGGT